MKFKAPLSIIETYLDSLAHAQYPNMGKVCAYEDMGIFKILISGSREEIYRIRNGVVLACNNKFKPWFKKLDKDAAEWAKLKRDEAYDELVDPIVMKQELDKIIDEG